MEKLTIGNIQFGPKWDKFFNVDREINDRVAKNMYKALQSIVNSKKLKPLQCNDTKAFDKCRAAIQEYQASYSGK